MSPPINHARVRLQLPPNRRAYSGILNAHRQASGTPVLVSRRGREPFRSQCEQTALLAYRDALRRRRMH